MNDADGRAVAAAQDERELEKFIKDSRSDILRIASSAAGRYITVSDNEWSTALFAFTRAVHSYSPERGAFFPYASKVIRSAIIDQYRRESEYASEISVSPDVLESGGEDEEEPEYTGTLVLRSLTAAAEARAEERSLAEEIGEATEELKRYGFTFYDLTECSPKKEKTRRDCAAAIRCVLAMEEQPEEMARTGRLPMERIAKETGVSAKTLDRHRRYIIAAVVILSGDYPRLAEYLRFVKEGGK